MTPIPQEREYTYADLLAWDDGVRYELYGGHPVALASPSDVHQEISGEIYFQIRNFLSGKPCKIYYAPFDVRLFQENGERPENVDTVVQPDLLVVCDPGKVDRRGVHGAPDLVIEILSDSTRRNDRLVKYNLYQRAGVREYWIVDPDSRVVSVYTLEEGAYHAAATYAAGAQVPVGLWDDFAVDLTKVFPET
jgi:Uma2 family endonuclease